MRLGNFTCRFGIIQAMRRGLSFMLVILLVLRGLLGDAMAMEMVSVTLSTEQHHEHASMASERGTSSYDQEHAGGNEHAVVVASASACQADETGNLSECGHASGPTCSACGICHSALFAPRTLAQPLPPQPCAQPSLYITPFASAAAVQAIKPPIF